MTGKLEMESLGAVIYECAQVDPGHDKRIVRGYPGPVECSQCGMMIEPRDMGEICGWTGMWAVMRLCYDGMVLGEVFAGRESHSMSCLEKAMKRDLNVRAASENPEYSVARLSKSGLHKAEQQYPQEWMERSLLNISPNFLALTPAAQKVQPFFRFIWGRAGTGVTTQLALTVRHQITEHRKRALMLTQARMFDSLRVGGGKTVADYIDLDFLAVDSFGSWRTEFEHDSMSSIISERARLFRPTIFGSDRPLDGNGGGHTCLRSDHESVVSGAVKTCFKKDVGCWFPAVWTTSASVANTIIVHCNGYRGITHLNKEHRELPDTLSPAERNTFQQRVGNQSTAPRQLGPGTYS